MRARSVSTGKDLVVLSAGTMRWWADRSSGEWVAFKSKYAIQHVTTIGPFESFEEAVEAAKEREAAEKKGK